MNAQIWSNNWLKFFVSELIRTYARTLASTHARTHAYATMHLWFHYLHYYFIPYVWARISLCKFTLFTEVEIWQLEINLVQAPVSVKIVTTAIKWY